MLTESEARRLESEDLAKQLGPQWSAFHSSQALTIAVMCDLSDGYQVLVMVSPHEVSTCVRQLVPQEFKSGMINVREYLTPFTPILYRPKEAEEAVVAVRKALQVQLDYADRACAALRRIAT
jgi:hypothetical protein